MTAPTAFLSYAKEDLRSARRLYKALRQRGIDVWFDKESLHPGQPWEPAVKRAIRESRYFLALISSRSISKVGYVNSEIYEALERFKMYPSHEAYLIPVRLNRCSPSHELLRGIQWVDLFLGWEPAVAKLVRVLAPRPQTSQDRDVPPLLRTDGLYVAETEGDAYRFYNLRFFADGSVVAVSSDWSPDQLAPHMMQTNPSMSVGKYTLRGTKIEFSTTSRSGVVVDYRGHLTRDTLVLRKVSQITHHRDVHEYTFRRVAPLASQAEDPRVAISRDQLRRKLRTTSRRRRVS